MIALVHGIEILLGAYLLAGIAFTPPFVIRGAGRIDPAARGATWGFRLILVPGVIALWPLLARRWLAGAAPPRERNAHRDAARGVEP